MAPHVCRQSSNQKKTKSQTMKAIYVLRVIRTLADLASFALAEKPAPLTKSEERELRILGAIIRTLRKHNVNQN